MDTGKTVDNCGKKISRRTYLTAAMTLFGLVNTSTNAFAVALSFGRETITIDDDYVLVDGWLLRTDDLIQ